MIVIRRFFLGGFLALATGAFFIRQLLGIVNVSGSSMAPVLEDGDRLLVWRCSLMRRLPKNRIVVVDASKIPTASSEDHPTPRQRFPKEFFVKRVIGLPMEAVIIQPSMLNRQTPVHHSAVRDSKGNLIWHIPSNHYFVKGYAPSSIDSVTWGPIPASSIVGIFLWRLPSGTMHASQITSVRQPCSPTGELEVKGN